MDILGIPSILCSVEIQCSSNHCLMPNASYCFGNHVLRCCCDICIFVMFSSRYTEIEKTTLNRKIWNIVSFVIGSSRLKVTQYVVAWTASQLGIRSIETVAKTVTADQVYRRYDCVTMAWFICLLMLCFFCETLGECVNFTPQNLQLFCFCTSFNVQYM